MQKGSIFENGFGVVAKKVMIDEDLGTTAKALYSLLCTYGDATNNTYAYPSIQYMADKLNIHKDTLYKYLDQLIEKDYIRKHKKKEKGKFARNEYEIVVMPEESPFPNSSDTVSSDTVSSDTENPETISTSSISTSSISTTNNIEDINLVWEHYKQAIKDVDYNPRKFGNSRKQAIDKLLNDFTLDEIKKAINNATNHKFMMGDNSDNKFHLLPEKMFKFKVIEQYLDYKNGVQKFEEADYYADL